MNRERFSHFLAVFAGIVVGALCSDAIAQHFAFKTFVWIPGALVGGIVAYIGVDVKKFVSGASLSLKQAWTQTIHWHPEPRYLLERAKFLATVTLALCTIGFWMPFVLFMTTHGKTLNNSPMGVLYISVVLSGLAGSLLGIIPLLFHINDSLGDRYCEREVRKLSHIMILLANPIVLPFSFCFIALPYCVKHASEAYKATKQFLVRFGQLLFLHVNTSRRVSAFIHAAIGASIGHLMGYTLIVAFIGAMIGVLEFELSKQFRESIADDRQTT